jgi:hypothetical protein
MLELKIETDLLNPVVIFVSRSKGRRLSFHPGETDPSEYPKLMLMGFTCFRCTTCKSDQCYGDCKPVEVSKVVVEKQITLMKEDTDLDLDIYGDIEEIKPVENSKETISDIEEQEIILDNTEEENLIICATCKEPMQDKRKKKYCSDKCKKNKNKNK